MRHLLAAAVAGALAVPAERVRLVCERVRALEGGATPGA